jgi:UDP-glucose 4-epimerase
MDGKPAAVVLSLEKYNQLLKPLASGSEISDFTAPLEREEKKYSILVTGGAGYIGSHAVRLLLDSGHKISIIDNISSGKRENLDARADFFEGDICDRNFLRDVFALKRFDVVMHFAASVEVEESVRNPEKYLHNNVFGTQTLLSVMQEFEVKKIIFSSTAAVYAENAPMPLQETSPLRPSNPYGYSKLLAEKLIKFYCQYLGFKAVIFRYFNACGCGYEGSILPTHQSHLLPIVMEVASGQRPFLKVNGHDYETGDGTCVRDFVHVMDIASAHLKAIEKMDEMAFGEAPQILNIGTGRGVSVKEMAECASEFLNKIIPMEMGQRRDGDVPVTVADSQKLRTEWGFEFKYSSLENIIKSSWQQINNRH